MTDSVDRVFVHALNTVRRIRSARPPSADRLRLYGLYKQSMEGNVDGIMRRPEGDDRDPDIRADQEKWEAWDAQRGLSKTMAKRHYIETLITTMHRYASQTPDARELVAELEFVWDQIKSNSPSASSSNSNPLHAPAISTTQDFYPSAALPGTYPVQSPTSPLTPTREEPDSSMLPLREPETPGREIFVDALDSQPENDGDDGASSSSSARSRENSDVAAPRTPPRGGLPSTPTPGMPPQGTSKRRLQLPPQTFQLSAIPLPQPPAQPPAQQHARDLQTTAGAFMAPLTNYLSKKSTTKTVPAAATVTTTSSPTNTTPITDPATAAFAATQKWQRRIESSLIQLTAELAALREQLDFQRQSSSALNLNILHPFRRSMSTTSPLLSQSQQPPWTTPRRTLLRLFVTIAREVSGILVRTVALNTLALLLAIAWLRWRRGLDGQDAKDVILGWVGRAADAVRCRSGAAAHVVGKARKELRKPFDMAPGSWTRAASASLGASGVRFLPVARAASGGI